MRIIPIALVLAAIVGCKTVPVWTTQPDPANPGSVIEVPVMDDNRTPNDPSDDFQKTRNVPDEDVITGMASLVFGQPGAAAAAGIFSLLGIVDRLIKRGN